MTTIYGLAVDGYVRTLDPDTRDAYTLVSAMQSARGCAGAQVVKSERGSGWRVVVDLAGTQHDAVHVTSGRALLRSRAFRGPLTPFGGWNRRRIAERMAASLRNIP
jgi:hypothetical protein